MSHLCVSSGFVQCDVAKFIVLQQNCQLCRITYPVVIWMFYVVLSKGEQLSKYHPWFHFSISLALLQYSIWLWMWNWAATGIGEDSGDKVGFGIVSKFNRLFTVPYFNLACVSKPFFFVLGHRRAVGVPGVPSGDRGNKNRSVTEATHVLRRNPKKD